MTFFDIRLNRMAQLLVRYSLNVQPGNLVAIQGGAEAIPLLREVYRETMRAGGHPELNIGLEEAREIYLKEANDDQLNFVSPVTQLINERFDCLLYIDAETNTRRLSRVEPLRIAKLRKAYDALDTIWSQRAAQGLMRWCYTQFPTHAYAQNANMSLEDYWEFGHTHVLEIVYNTSASVLVLHVVTRLYQEHHKLCAILLCEAVLLSKGAACWFQRQYRADNRNVR